MPRATTSRQERLRGLTSLMLIREFLEMDGEELTLEEQEDRLLLDMATYHTIQNTRYSVQRTRIPRSGSLHTLWQYARSPAHHDLFKKLVRVTPTTFQQVLLEIQGNPIFSNNSHHAQAPVEDQLAIALYRLGRFGNAASMDDVAFLAAVGHGTTMLYTRRIITALMDVHGRWIRPLTAQEREEEREWVLERVGCPEFAPGIYHYDGTCSELWQKPGLNGDAYFNRGMYYGLNIQIGCVGSNLRIIDYCVGHTGAAHDSLAFRSTGAYLHPDTIFEGDEFAWADSAYTASYRIIPIHKAPANLDPDVRAFDRAASRLRVSVENCIGQVKCRFQSLRGLRININRRRDHIRAMHWVSACLILHNICVELGGDGWELDEEVGGLHNARPVVADDDQVEGGARRQELVNAYHRYRHGE